MKKTYEQILCDLFKSKATGHVVSLKVRGTEKLLLTAVQEVKGNRIVVLNPVSVYGSMLEESVYHLEDIENVRVYNTHYFDPLFVRIRELKNNIDDIRKSLRW